MFDHKHYVPILKGKEGDFWALRHLKAQTRDLVTPVIEVVPPSASQSEVKRLEKTVSRIQTSWPGNPAFVDLLWLESVGVLPSGSHVVSEFFGLARQQSLTVIPVTSPARNPAYQQAIRGVVQQDQRGMAVRIPPQILGNASVTNQALNGLLNLMSLQASHVDLILDFRGTVDIDPNLLSQLMAIGLNSLPSLADWRTITVAAGSFPATVTVLNQGVWTTLPRREWLAWTTLLASGNQLARRPSYGDYAVGDPELPYAGRANFAANLRYSAGDDYLVWRGHAIGSHPQGHGQIFPICASLIARSEFAGPTFSQGDAEIHAKATIQDSPGGPQQWREWATSHYIELVASQIASLP